MNTKLRNNIIFIALVVILVLVFGGISYAYFTSFTNSESASTVYTKGGTMKIAYSNKSGNISVANIYPREAAWATKSFTVTGNNTTALEMPYRIVLTIDKNTFTHPLFYSLTGSGSNGTLVPNATNVQIQKSGHQIVGSGKYVQANNAEHTYVLSIFYKPKANTDQNEDQQASFAAHIIIDNGLEQYTN